MDLFSYDNIDLFYYHSTDIDVTRFYSIIKYGILSAAMAKENNLSYYHRNYINSSCKNNYISVSHFSRTLWHHFHLQNELYDSSINKITFVLRGTIDALDKQHYKNRYIYTTERHIKDAIKKEDIIGILIRESYINKEIRDIPFPLKYSNWNDSIKKCFDTILFFKEIHGYEDDYSKLYYLIGKLVESKVLNENQYDDRIQEISLYMQEYIDKAYENILNTNKVFLKDIICLYAKDIPIYVMTKYDIQEMSNSHNLIKTAEDKYNRTYPNKNFKAISKKEQRIIKEEDKLLLEKAKLEIQMRESDLQIYYDGKQGPLTEDSEKIMQKVIKLK